MVFLLQEEEKRIASVMARKEEEKKKEISKLAVLKVLHVSDRCCLPDLATQKNDENEILGHFP